MDDQLKQLMDYTKFHIGMYVTLSTLLVGLLGVSSLAASVPALKGYLFATLTLFLLAGMFGGLVGSSLPHYKTFAEFETARLGPWGLALLPAQCCIRLEHLSFWLGTLVAWYGVLRVLVPRGG
jgi:hypothetical protein